MIEGHVTRDGQNPGQNRCAPPISRPGVVDFHPGNLQRVIDFVVGAQPPAQARGHRSAKLRKQVVEGDGVAVDVALHERFEGVGLGQVLRNLSAASARVKTEAFA